MSALCQKLTLARAIVYRAIRFNISTLRARSASILASTRSVTVSALSASVRSLAAANSLAASLHRSRLASEHS